MLKAFSDDLRIERDSCCALLPVQVYLSRWWAGHQTWTWSALSEGPERSITVEMEMTACKGLLAHWLRFTSAVNSPVVHSKPSWVCWGVCAFWFWTEPQNHPALQPLGWCDHSRSWLPPAEMNPHKGKLVHKICTANLTLQPHTINSAAENEDNYQPKKDDCMHVAWTVILAASHICYGIPNISHTFKVLQC